MNGGGQSWRHGETPFLRRHYPDQVQRSGADLPPSQPGTPGSRGSIPHHPPSIVKRRAQRPRTTRSVTSRGRDHPRTRPRAERNARSPRRSAPGGCRTIGHRRSPDTAPAISTRRTSLGSPSARGVRLGVGGSRWQGGVLRAEHCQNGCQAAAHQCRRHPHFQPESYRGRWTAPALPARPP
jgi:hypothetical protein